MTLQEKLIGALIGITRASNGNEIILTKDTDKLVVESLLATRENAAATEDTLLSLIERAVEEKKRIIPNCFYCESTCLRKMDYNMASMENEDEAVRAVKLELLATIQKLAAVSYQEELAGTVNKERNEFFYTALYAIGMDWSESELRSVLEQAISY